MSVDDIDARNGHHAVHIDAGLIHKAKVDDLCGKGGQDPSYKLLFSRADSYDTSLMLTGSLFAILTGMSLPVSEVLFGRVLDALNTSQSNRERFERVVAEICIAFAILAFANLITGFFQIYFWSVAGERQVVKFKSQYVQALLRQEVGWFDEQGANELATRVADLGGKLQDGLGKKTANIVQFVAQFVASFAIAFYLCPLLAAVLLATIPLQGITLAYLAHLISAALSQSLTSYAKAGGVATESLSAIRTVTALNIQPQLILKFKAYVDEAKMIGIAKMAKVGLNTGIVFFVFIGTSALGFWYGAKLVADDIDSGCEDRGNCLTGGSVMACFFCILIGSLALGEMAPLLSAFLAAKVAAQHMTEVIERESHIDGMSADGIRPTSRAKGGLVLKDVRFAYPSRPDIMVCKGYNLRIEPGETVAFVGRSGAGKSTVMNLLLRFYDPQSGDITLDGVSTRDLNIIWLRSQLGYVGQEPVLFSGTITENIANGIPDSERESLSVEEINERVVKAAAYANAHSFISEFPQGYDTLVGSSGVAMSGGQKQRIAIARALIKNPAILLLDEATSALDATSERVVQESIDSLQQSKAQTTIVIAHRLSTIRNADKIAVVDDGVIAELGTHDELLALGGVYKELVSLQMQSGSGNSNKEENFSIKDSEEDIPKDIEANGIQAAASTVEPAIQLSNEDRELTAEEEKAMKRQIWIAILRHKHWLFVGLIGALTFSLVFPIWGVLIATTQSLFYQDNTDDIRSASEVVAVYLALIGIAALVGAYLQYWGVAQCGERVTAGMRVDLFHALMRRDISFFDREENTTGALTTRLSDDSRIVQKSAGESAAKQLQAICILLLSIGLSFAASWKMSLVMLAVFPLNAAFSALEEQEYSGAKEMEFLSSKGRAGGIISNAFINFRTVSAFSMQESVLKSYIESIQFEVECRYTYAKWSGIAKGGNQFVTLGSYGLLFWFGSTLILSGEINFEQMMTAIMVLIFAAFGLGSALADIGDQKNALRAAQRIFRVIEYGKTCDIDGLSSEGIVPTQAAVGRIELRNVSFSYPSRPEIEVCKSYNLVIEPGELVAFVGPSGSGKSTIMSLLLRFYDCVEGEVLLDGENIKNLNVRWLRSQIGYVGQEPVLFSGSVAENIKKGRAPIDVSLTDHDSLSFHPTSERVDEEKARSVESVESEIIDAATASNAHGFITTFPEQYNTDVGQGSIWSAVVRSNA